MAEQTCALCHTVEPGQTHSPNHAAPAFPDIAASPGLTATAIRVWLQTPHPTMPNVAFNNKEKDNIVAYLLSSKAVCQVRHMSLKQFSGFLLAGVLLHLGVCDHAFASTAVERGKTFVEKNCARCDAIGPIGSSPYAPAPALPERYDIGDLAEAFAEGIIVFHESGPQMPQFMLQPDQIDDLIACLRSVQPKTATH